MKHDELLSDILRAEVAHKDLQEVPHGVAVFAMRNNGDLYEIGHVSQEIAYGDPSKARALIERIKFARRSLA